MSMRFGLALAVRGRAGIRRRLVELGFHEVDTEQDGLMLVHVAEIWVFGPAALRVRSGVPQVAAQRISPWKPRSIATSP